MKINHFNLNFVILSLKTSYTLKFFFKQLVKQTDLRHFSIKMGFLVVNVGYAFKVFLSSCFTK